MSTIRRSSTSAPSSCITGRARCAQQPRIRSCRHLPGPGGDPAVSSITCCAPCRAAGASSSTAAMRILPRRSPRAAGRRSRPSRCRRRRPTGARTIGAGTARGASRCIHAGRSVGWVDWTLLGAHNVMNALAAIAAAAQAGVQPSAQCRRWHAFAACAAAWSCAAWPAGLPSTTTSRTTRPRSRRRSSGLRAPVGAARIVAVLEPRSNTMRLGVHRERLRIRARRGRRGMVLCTAPISAGTCGRGQRRSGRARIARQRRCAGGRALASELRAGDHVLVMSNGGFGGLHGKLLHGVARPGRARAGADVQRDTAVSAARRAVPGRAAAAAHLRAALRRHGRPLHARIGRVSAWC